MAPNKKSQFAKDLREKESVASAFLVKFSAVGVDKNGKPFMNLIFMDRTGEVEGKAWEDIPSYSGQVVRDAFVYVEGRTQTYQGRRQIVVNRMQVLREDEINPKDFLIESHLDAEALYSKLLEYVG